MSKKHKSAYDFSKWVCCLIKLQHYLPASGDSVIRVGGSPRQAINDNDDNINNKNTNNNKGP
jgi:hypothetical protein